MTNNPFPLLAWQRYPLISREFIQTGGLILAIVISAFAVIYSQDIHRRLLIDKQHLEAQQRRLQVERGKLLLEQGTLASQARIQQLAQRRLGMRAPGPTDIVLMRVKSTP